MRRGSAIEPRWERGRGMIAAALLAVAATACEQRISDDPEGDVGSVEVVYGDRAVTVDLADLDAVTLDDGEEHARLSDVVEAAGLGVALEALELDFEGADGFRSSSTSTCVDHIPAPGALLRQGYVHLRSRNVTWDAELDMPGCTFVHDLARILASDAGTARTDVEVVYEGEGTLVDLRSLEAVDLEGEPHVRLADVVAWADLGVPLAGLEADLEGADGSRPGDVAACADLVPLPGRLLADGFVHLETRDLVWDAAAGLPSCMAVANLARVEVSDRAIAGPTVDVAYGGVTVTVGLDEAEAVDFEGSPAVRLADVVALASLGVPTAELVLDFEASDGFRPAMSSPCEGLFPRSGAELEGGYVRLEGPDLVWEPALGLPGCAYVDDLALIEATDASPGEGPFVDVAYGGTTVTVDLAEAAVTSFRGEPHVRLADAVALADLGVPTADLVFDFVASDGFRSSDTSTCDGVVPMPGERLAEGYIHLETRDVDWEDAAAMPGCVHLHDLAIIEAADA